MCEFSADKKKINWAFPVNIGTHTVNKQTQVYTDKHHLICSCYTFVSHKISKGSKTSGHKNQIIKLLMRECDS